MAGRVTYEAGRLRAYTTALPHKADALAQKLAEMVEALAKQLAPVRTGALRSSIQSRREANARWVVFVGVLYGIFVEFGTYKMGAQPFFVPALARIGAQMVQLARAEFAL